MVSLVAARRLASCYLRGMPRRRANQAFLAQLQATAAPAVAPITEPRRSYSRSRGDLCRAQTSLPYVRSSGDLTWGQFLEGGSKGVSGTVVLEGGRRVKVSWVDGHESEFSLKWLRDHSTGAFNSHTKQRELDTYAVPNDTRIKDASVETLPSPSSNTADTGSDTRGNPSHQILRLRWSAEANEAEHEECTVPIGRLRQHCSSETARSLRQRSGSSIDGASHRPTPVLWGANVFSSPTGDNDPPIVEFDAVMDGRQLLPSTSTTSSPSVEDRRQPSPTSSSSQTAASHLISLVRSHGIALVRGVPADKAGTQALALKVGGHLRSTLYGPDMWATSAEASDGEEEFRDSAYSSDALALHTDCTYLRDPPGLQVFNCVVSAEEGGASIYLDGFAVAERLRVESPEAFDFFSRTSLTYNCFDDGCHYMAEGPIFRLGPLGLVDQVRHNDYDRAPLDWLSNDDIDRFYEHHKSLSAILRDPSMVARILLEPGDTVILDNQRAMHGRESFKGSSQRRRRMVGCYLGMDEVESMARVHRL